jgi:hypothetical protein
MSLYPSRPAAHDRDTVMALTTHRRRSAAETIEASAAEALDALLVEEFVLWTSACHFLRIATRDTPPALRQVIESQCVAITELVDDVVRRSLYVGGRPYRTLEWLHDGVTVVTPTERGTRDAVRTLAALHDALRRAAALMATFPSIARVPALAAFCERLAARHRREAAALLAWADGGQPRAISAANAPSVRSSAPGIMNMK